MNRTLAWIMAGALVIGAAGAIIAIVPCFLTSHRRVTPTSLKHGTSRDHIPATK